MYNATDQKDLSLAQAGMQHLRTAEALLKAIPETPFNAQRVGQAQHEFSDALIAFSQVNGDLKSLPGISTSIPVNGSRLSAALHLLPIAIQLSQMAITGGAALELLISRFHGSLNTGSQGISTADFPFIEEDFHRIEGALSGVVNRINHVSPGDLQVDPRIVLQGQSGWQARGKSTALGRQVWAGYFTLSYGQTKTIVLDWTVPGGATKDGKGWHYQYLIQRQAGAEWIMHLEIILPSCAVMTSTSGGLLSDRPPLLNLWWKTRM